MGHSSFVNPSQHKHLRVLHDPSAIGSRTGRNVSLVLSEFQQAAAEYPLLMTKNKNTGQFVCVAFFGFDEGENLFVEQGRWKANYIPLNIQRQPFLIGSCQGDDGKEKHLALIDETDERVRTDSGEALFNERGFPTPFMERVTAMLKTLKDGLTQTQDFIDNMLSLDLVAPATFKITFDTGDRRQLEGLYTLHQSRLDSLTANQVAELHAKGFLQPAYMMLVSLGQMPKLIERKNRHMTGNHLAAC